jgi:DNA-binding response OmpR family regulator
MNATSPVSRGRILIVEDDPDAALFATHVLGNRGGFEVRQTADPAVALRLAADERWDLVLIEAYVPGMTGLELIDALRRLAPALPVVVLTGYAPPAQIATALRSRADDYLTKPLGVDRLIATAAAVIGRGRPR